MSVRKKWQGIHSGRYQREPMERAFAKAWQEFCESSVATDGQPTLLDYLLTTDQQHPLPASDRDRQVACTVIQWLGSSVGQQFLSQIGFGR